jgi:septal ring factor EnvC (AmiA/AmiB activator)
MEGMPAPENREKLSHWVQEGLRFFPHLASLLHGEEGARAHELEREMEKLRRELADARRELDDLRKEHERLRADRDEVGHALSRLMDSIQPINQLAHRLGFRRSPFEREHRPPADPKASGDPKPSGDAKAPAEAKTPGAAPTPAPKAG